MKLIIECTEQTYSECKKISGLSETAFVIAHGKPYDDSGDLISRKDLQTKHDESCAGECACCAYGVDYTKSSDSKFHCLLIDNAPTVEPRDNFDLGYVKGLEDMKRDIITLIANEYTSHGELIPNWLTIGETKVSDRQKKGGAE